MISDLCNGLNRISKTNLFQVVAVWFWLPQILLSHHGPHSWWEWQLQGPYLLIRYSCTTEQKWTVSWHFVRWNFTCYLQEKHWVTMAAGLFFARQSEVDFGKALVFVGHRTCWNYFFAVSKAPKYSFHFFFALKPYYSLSHSWGHCCGFFDLYHDVIESTLINTSLYLSVTQILTFFWGGGGRGILVLNR